MREIRNSDGRLVCKVDERASAIEICAKGCVTRIEWTQDGQIKVVNSKNAA